MPRCLERPLHDADMLRVPVPAENLRHAYYRFYVFLRGERLHPDWNMARIIDALLAAGIRCDTGICPEIYREPAYRNICGSDHVRLSCARELGETSIAFPVHPGIGAERIGAIARSVRTILARALQA